MYTIKGLLDGSGQNSVLANAKDWAQAREKAAEMRGRGLVVEIWHENGVKVDEPEIGMKTIRPDEVI